MSAQRAATRIIVFAMLIVSACGAAPTKVPPTPTPHPVTNLPKTFDQMVDVGGYKLQVSCWGNGSPTVVLETGAGTSIDAWRNVQAKIPANLRYCAYNRAGLGMSDPAPISPRTTADHAKDLRAVITKAGITPPYILMAHSLGGLTARQYATQYPQDVAGILLVDSTHPDQTAAQRSTLPSQAVGESEAVTKVRAQLQDSFLQNVPAEFGGLNIYESMQQAKAAGSLGSIPLVVLAESPSGVARSWPSGLPPDVYAKLADVWMGLQHDLTTLSTNSTYMEAENSGHMIMIDEPEAILRALDVLVQKIKTK
jgi:pimeloyl-ACP methyl ester carboxylesterase